MLLLFKRNGTLGPVRLFTRYFIFLFFYLCVFYVAGLSGFALFVAIFSIFLSSFMLLVPVAYERYHKMIRLAHALKEVRVSSILTGAGFTFELLIA